MEELERDNSLKALRDLDDQGNKSTDDVQEDSWSMMGYFSSCAVYSRLSFTHSIHAKIVTQS